jgi:hypothetical protein
MILGKNMKNLQKLMFLIALLVSGIEAKIDEVVIQNFMDVYGIADPYAEKYLRTLSHDQLNDLTQSSDNPADVKAEFEFMLESYLCEKSDKIIAPDQEVIPLQQAQAASRAEARSAESRCVKELRRLQQALAQSPVIAYFKNLFVHDSDLKFLAQSSLQENYKGGESFGNACFLDTV